MAEAAPANDFYQTANGWWLDDPSVTIPGEYASWGSFIQLHDNSLKTQVSLCEELAAAAESTEELLLARVWNASIAKFASWEDGAGVAGVNGNQPALDELAQLEACNVEGADAWVAAITKYFGRCCRRQIGMPFDFDKMASLKDSENVILELGPAGTSLPSRDHYFEDNFEKQRGWFREHLTRIGTMFEFDADFAERVIRFETKLATINMKQSQSRQYDQYFTITTLEGFISDINSMKHLEEKLENYAAVTVADDEPDKAALSDAQFQLDDEAQAAMKTFVESLYTELGLAPVMSANYKANYTDKGVLPAEPETAEFRMLAFDGDYFRRLFGMITGEAGMRNKDDLLAYMKYKIVRSAGQYCTKALDEEMFEFYSRQLGGQKEQKSAQKRTVARVNGWVGELLGKAYVARYFSEEDKTTVVAMIHDVIEIMKCSLETNDWLTGPTQQKALQKLAKFTIKIGYPDVWKSFERLELNADDDIFTISQKVKAFEYETEFLEKLNSPKDKTKWEMHPQQVNAYYHPLNNEIVFPAAILQPPFYSKKMEDVQFGMGEYADTPKALEAINFGAIGAVIAHEITHGFDDQGRKFDAEGNINEWWEEADAQLFKAKTDIMEKQAELYEYVDTDNQQKHKMNGQLTMGENLADLGGMSLALQAMEKRFGPVAPEEAEQRQAQIRLLFLSWANVWKSKASNADMIQKLATDPHAPTQFRANLVKNVDQFYTAFGVDESNPMYIPKEARVQMW